MRVEIVLHQKNFFGVWKISIRCAFQKMSIIDSGAAIGDFHMAPTFERRKHHEYVDRAIPFIFMILAPQLSRLHRYRCARFQRELFRRFIDTKQRLIGITRSPVNFKHILHRCYEGGVSMWWNNPLFLEVRLQNVFFRTRPTVLLLVAGTMASSTTLSASKFRVQCARPSAAGEQRNRTSLGS